MEKNSRSQSCQSTLNYEEIQRNSRVQKNAPLYMSSSSSRNPDMSASSILPVSRNIINSVRNSMQSILTKILVEIARSRIRKTH